MSRFRILVSAGAAVTALAIGAAAVAAANTTPPGDPASFTDVTIPGTSHTTVLPPEADGSTRTIITVDGNFAGALTGPFHTTILRVAHLGGNAVLSGVDFCTACVDLHGNAGQIANHLIGGTNVPGAPNTGGNHTATGAGLGGLSNDRGTFTLLRLGTPPVTTDVGYLVTTADCRTGRIDGPQNAGAGDSLCFGPGAVVNGPVRVSDGAELFARGATINGPVRVNGATAVSICGSTITGPVTIAGGVGPALVGEPASFDCDGNTFTGPVELTDNAVGLDFSGNTVNGPFRASGNVGFMFGDFAPNTFNGPVSTSGNN